MFKRIDKSARVCYNKNRTRRSKKMFSNERIDGILKYMKEKKSVRVDELAAKFFASPATIRRDLKEMHKMGLIERSYGGAVYYEGAEEVSIFVRLEKSAKEKEMTATLAINRLPDFQSVFIDNSSSCLALAQRLNLTGKTVITNGLQIASKLSCKENVNIIMPGGEVHYNTNSLTGSLTCNMLKNFCVDLMLSSCAAIVNGGTYEHSLDTMQLKRQAYAISAKRYLLIDSTKLTLTATYRTTDVKQYDAIITCASDAQVELLRAEGATVYNH